jgi:hypothetical protein
MAEFVNTWFSCGTFFGSDPLRVKSIFTSENVARRQQATLGSVDVITFACAGPLAWSQQLPIPVQVDGLVHSSIKTYSACIAGGVDELCPKVGAKTPNYKA